MSQTGDVVLVTGSSKAIAWLEEVALPKDREPFIKHWTIDIADDHYELDITAARVRLGWKPQHRLHAALRDIVRGLRADPAHVIGTWCTLCLLAALAMIIMIPYSLDELVAMGQFLLHAKRAGRSAWRLFWVGGAMPDGAADKSKEFAGMFREMAREAAQGVTVPWTLLLSSALGVWLMFTRLIFGTEGSMANSDHLLGSLTITFAVMAMAEVARPVRFINVLFGLWLIAAPWVLSGASAVAAWGSVFVGIVLILLSLPRGPNQESPAGTGLSCNPASARIMSFVTAGLSVRVLQARIGFMVAAVCVAGCEASLQLPGGGRDRAHSERPGDVPGR